MKLSTPLFMLAMNAMAAAGKNDASVSRRAVSLLDSTLDTAGSLLNTGLPVNCVHGCTKDVNNPGCYILTQQLQGQVGVVWGVDKVNIKSSFQIDTKVNLGQRDLDGADGIGLIFQNLGNGIAGAAGGGLGYLSLSEYFAVELDTYQNHGEIPEDHLQVKSKAHGDLSSMIALENIEDNQFHDFRVTWDESTKELKVYLKGTLRLTVDLPNGISPELPGNPDTAFFGFTGTTGSLHNTQTVCIPEQVIEKTDAPTASPRTHTDPPTNKPPGGGSHGDPHVRLWNGETFDFHGACDLVLVKAAEFANGLGLDINIRTKQQTWWSFIESAVLRVGSDTFEVQGGLNSATYWINGEKGELSEVGLAGYLDQTLAGYQVHYKSVSNKQKDFRLDLGNGDWITFQTFNDFVRVNVKTGGMDKKSRFTGAVGLMGEFPDGKMVDRTGDVVKDTDAFGKGWQVLVSEDMLFQNVEGVQHPQECEMPDMTKKSLKRRLGEALISEEDAALACGRVSEEDREACIFDVMATNDKDMAGSY